MDSNEIKLENIFNNCTSLVYVNELEIFNFRFLSNIYGVFNSAKNYKRYPIFRNGTQVVLNLLEVYLMNANN